MQRILLDPIPNQQFDLQVDGVRYSVEIKETRDGMMCCTIERDGIEVVSGQIIPAWSPLIPFVYLEHGNFIFETPNDEIPYYTEFGAIHRLFYVSVEELASIYGSASI